MVTIKDIEIMKEAQDVNRLIQALKDNSEEVRTKAAYNLGTIGDKKAVKPLIRVLNDNSPNVKYVAILSLAKLKDKRAIEPLIKMVNDKAKATWEISIETGEQITVGSIALSALSKISPEKAIEPLIQALKDDNVTVRYTAAESIGKIGDKKAVEPLILALNDASTKVRYNAIRSLAKLKDERAIGPLLKLINDKANVGWIHVAIRGENTVGIHARNAIAEISPGNSESYIEQERIKKQKRTIELEIKGFSKKEIEAIIDYGYTEHQILKMRDSGKKIGITKLTPQATTIHIEKVESLESIGGSKISDSVVQRSTVGGTEESFSNCPYCGKKFKLKKTPRFCPYCNEELS